MPLTRNTYIAPLTGLRFIAASLVVFFHYFEAVRVFDGASLPLITLVNGNGQTGVSIFFALSGFLITSRYRDQWAAKTITFWHYWRRRFIRIYPAYFVALVALVIFPEILTGSVAYFNAGVIGGLLLLGQAFALSLFPLGIPIGWTLTLEEIYYVCAPQLALLLNARWSGSILRILVGGAIVVAMCAVATAMIVLVPSTYAFTGFSEEFIYQVSMFVRLPEFVAGAVGGLILLKVSAGETQTLRQIQFSTAAVGAGALLGIVCFLTSNSFFLIRAYWISAILRFAGAAFSALLMLGFALQRTPGWFGRWLGSPTMEYLGRASYSLYLVHLTKPLQWIWQAVKLLPIHPIALVPIIFVISVGASVLLYEFVERPVHDRLARLNQSSS